VNDGPYEPFSGASGSLIASMGSIAVGFGTMLAAPSKALYAAAMKKAKTFDSETSSIRSVGSFDSARDFKRSKKSILRSFASADSGSVPMQKTLSDQSVPSRTSSRTPPRSITPSIDQENERKDYGQKGLGKVIKSTLEGNSNTIYLLMVAPVNFSVAIAQGWHNLPVLYGQKVRHSDNVTDFKSGIKTGGKVRLSL